MYIFYNEMTTTHSNSVGVENIIKYIVNYYNNVLLSLQKRDTVKAFPPTLLYEGHSQHAMLANYHSMCMASASMILHAKAMASKYWSVMVLSSPLILARKLTLRKLYHAHSDTFLY